MTIITTKSDPRPPSDVVFLIEATSNLEQSFNEIKSSYLGQILSYFNSAFGDESDVAIDVSINFLLLSMFFNSHILTFTYCLLWYLSRAESIFIHW